VRVASGSELGPSTWTDLDRRPPVLLAVPLGSCEQHGPHLPLDTDTRVATALAQGLASHRADVLVAPAIALAASGEHAGFPGTLSIGTAVLADLLVELVRSADWAAGVVVVNGHGGNTDALRTASGVAQAEGRRLLTWWPPSMPGHDAHAGRTETSVMLALAPHLVGTQRPTGATEPLEHLWAALRNGGVSAVSETGVLGDARGADADEGRRLLETWTADLVDRVESWSPSGRS